ncbi:MAG: helix-hairpin-helix domain-containing protein [Bacteroidales bacterium]|nr:helix-hairpin-helix domain-containing protein [Bacteroidales bacterium]MCF8458020.1 helix-hairpin-helix domain-containing protein [Bacteroidales bacterium]
MWKDYFSFSKSEQIRISTLLVVIVVIICGRWYLANYSQPRATNFSSFEKEVIAFENSLEKIETKPSGKKLYAEKSLYDSLELFTFDPNTCSGKDFKMLGLNEKQIGILENYRSKGGRFYNAADFSKIYGIPKWQSDILANFISIPRQDKRKTEKSKIELSPFDPNTVEKEKLLQLGIAEWIASNIIKYREKGGFFETKQDLLKIYGIDSVKYQELEPYILLPEEKQITEIRIDTLAVTKGTLLVGLNSADTSLLKKLPGIGDVFALRIVKYRECLGGFVDKKQLLEVYGMQETRYEKIKELVFVDRPAMKIAINFADQKELQNHPYLNFEQARAIIKFRNKKGSFTSINQLLEEGIVDENSYEKIKYYLDLNN